MWERASVYNKHSMVFTIMIIKIICLWAHVWITKFLEVEFLEKMVCVFLIFIDTHLNWVSLEVDSESRIQMQIVYLGGRRKPNGVVGKWDREGKVANHGCAIKSITTLGPWSSILQKVQETLRASIDTSLWVILLRGWGNWAMGPLTPALSGQSLSEGHLLMPGAMVCKGKAVGRLCFGFWQ